MTRTRVKICGITRPQDARAAAKLGAWAVGFIFTAHSPRRVSLEAAGLIAAALPKGVLRVGVFLDQPEEEIRRAEEAAGLDLFQLHGAESSALCRNLGEQRCIKTVFPQEESSLAGALAQPAQYLLIDRLRGAGANAPVDWTLAARLTAQRPKTLLAGALTPENVAAAIRRVRPWGVDVAGSLERSPGVKDPAKLRAFFTSVRRAAAAGGAAP